MAKTLTDAEFGIEQLIDKPWITIVWDDPVNLMSYVVFVFQKLFGFSKEKAHELMMQIPLLFRQPGHVIVGTSRGAPAAWKAPRL